MDTCFSSFFLAISTWGIFTTSIKVDTYEAEAKLKLRKNSASSSLTDVSRELGALAPLANQSNPVDTEAEVIKSKSIIKKTINDLNLKNSTGQPLKIQQVLSKLQVSAISNTDVLKITYQDSDPQKATEIVNTLIANYLESNVTANKIEALEARRFLEEQIPKARKELLETESSIKEIKIKNQILSPEEEASKLTSSIEDVEKRIREARSEIANLTLQSEYIKERLNMNAQQALDATNISQSSAVKQIVTQLKELEFQLNQERSRFTENNPQIIELKEKIRLQKQLLANEIKDITGSYTPQSGNNTQFAQFQQELAVELIRLESSSAGYTQQVAYLAEIEKDLKKKASNLPQIEQKLAQLSRQLGVSQNTYDLLQNQLSLIEVAANQNIGNTRVISYAIVPDTPVSSRSVGYLSAVSLGLIAAAGVVYLLEASDRSLRTIEEAKQLFGYNGLGMIPSFDKSQLATLSGNSDSIIPPLIIRDDPGSPISESYRMLQSNLRYLNGDRSSQAIVVTSSISGEGKSTVAANLAGAMAQVGHKVLLVDADLHSPIQQDIWSTYSDSGLSDLLADNLDFRLATETVMKNLSIVTSGAIPPSPATLLDSYKMKDLVHYWSRLYDFVIIDSPSLDVAADAPILGRIADGILLVVKPEEINRSQANFAKETLQRSGQNVLGIVFNDVNPKVDANCHYYHPLDTRQNALPGTKPSHKVKEEFWDSIIRLSEDSPKLTMSSTTNPQQLLDTPVAKLEETINYLQQDLQELSDLVKEQEDELFQKRQAVRKLQRKVNLSPISERSSLQLELAQEQEIKQMLDETLVGQRRNLNRKRQILRQYQEILQVKQH